MRKCNYCNYPVEVGYQAEEATYCEWCIVLKIEELERKIKELTKVEVEVDFEPLDEMIL